MARERRKVSRHTSKEVGKCSWSRKTNVLFCGLQSSRKYFRQEAETATVAWLRAIPSFCNKQGRCVISAVPLKFETEFSAIFQGCSFPKIYKLIVQFSKKCHGEFLHRIFSLRGISNTRQENALVSQHLANLTHMNTCFSPSPSAADTGKDINPVSEGAAAFENRKEMRNTNKGSICVVTSTIPGRVQVPNAQPFSCSNRANLLDAVFPPSAQNTCIVRSPHHPQMKIQALLMSS